MRYLISWGGNIYQGERKNLRDSFTRVLRFKKISSFHSIATVEMEEIKEGQEFYWICNGRRVYQEIGTQEPMRDMLPYYPKSTLLWGEYQDGNNPYLILIPINEDFMWDDAMKSINSGLDAFLRKCKQPEWTWQEVRAYRIAVGRWSLYDEIQMGLKLIGKGNDDFSLYKEQAVAAVKNALLNNI